MRWLGNPWVRTALQFPLMLLFGGLTWRLLQPVGAEAEVGYLMIIVLIAVMMDWWEVVALCAAVALAWWL